MKKKTMEIEIKKWLQADVCAVNFRRHTPEMVTHHFGFNEGTSNSISEFEKKYKEALQFAKNGDTVNIHSENGKHVHIDPKKGNSYMYELYPFRQEGENF